MRIEEEILHQLDKDKRVLHALGVEGKSETREYQDVILEIACLKWVLKQ